AFTATVALVELPPRTKTGLDVIDSEKSGSGLITSPTVVVFVAPPPPPEMVSGYVPAGLDTDVEILKVDDPEPPAIVPGANPAVTPAGRPLMPSATLFVKPNTGAEVTV